MQDKEIRLKGLIDQLSEVLVSTTLCEICCNLDSVSPCVVCYSRDRDRSVLAVVETVVDLWAIERSGAYKGLYHVLSGSSIKSPVTEDNMSLVKLGNRCLTQGIREVIIATNATLEGQTAAYLITEHLKSYEIIKISRLAGGVPIGGELDYLDDGTLSLAISCRRPFE
jgi:recombination protein RecR